MYEIRLRKIKPRLDFYTYVHTYRRTYVSVRDLVKKFKATSRFLYIHTLHTYIHK